MKLLVGLLVALLLSVACRDTSRTEGRSRMQRMQALVSLDKTTVRLGDDLEIRVDGVPDGWSGTMRVNSGNQFELKSTRYVLKATRQNGFSTSVPTELYFFLKDRHFREIPVANSGFLNVKVVEQPLR